MDIRESFLFNIPWDRKEQIEHILDPNIPAGAKGLRYLDAESCEIRALSYPLQGQEHQITDKAMVLELTVTTEHQEDARYPLFEEIISAAAALLGEDFVLSCNLLGTMCLDEIPTPMVQVYGGDQEATVYVRRMTLTKIGKIRRVHLARPKGGDNGGQG